MEIKKLKKRPGLNQNHKLDKAYTQFSKLLDELGERELPPAIIHSINTEIEKINSISVSENEWRRQLRKVQSRILKLLEKELKLVPKNHYRNIWLSVGMAAFGLPIGVSFGISLGNMAFLAIGIPFGISIGIALGTAMDKKAFEQGRQLDLEIKYY